MFVTWIRQFTPYRSRRRCVSWWRRWCWDETTSHSDRRWSSATSWLSIWPTGSWATHTSSMFKATFLLCPGINVLKTVQYRKHNWIGHTVSLHGVIEWQMMGKPTCGRKRTELLHDMMENTYIQLKDLELDRKAWNQESRERLLWTCWTQQETKQEGYQCTHANLNSVHTAVWLLSLHFSFGSCRTDLVKTTWSWTEPGVLCVGIWIRRAWKL